MATLKVPLLGAAPAVSTSVSLKSGARAVFRAARVNVTPGAAVPPVVTPSTAASLAVAPTGVHGTGDAEMGLSFEFERGQLQVSEAAQGGGGRRRQGERKDRVLVEALAKLMVEHLGAQARSQVTELKLPFSLAASYANSACSHIAGCAILLSAEASTAHAELVRRRISIMNSFVQPDC